MFPDDNNVWNSVCSLRKINKILPCKDGENEVSWCDWSWALLVALAAATRYCQKTHVRAPLAIWAEISAVNFVESTRWSKATRSSEKWLFPLKNKNKKIPGNRNLSSGGNYLSVPSERYCSQEGNLFCCWEDEWHPGFSTLFQTAITAPDAGK